MSTIETKPEKREELAPTTTMGWDTAGSFVLMQRVATALASSTLVPKEYQGSSGIGNCLIALNMASRMGADPLMVIQNLQIIHGRPGWSAQFLIATFNCCGRFSALRYEWQGEKGKDDWGCRAWAKELATGERIEGPWVTWAMVKAEGWSSRNGSKWLTMPEVMFHYRSAAFLVRTHAPEIAMGLQTAEENEDRPVQLTQVAPGVYETRENGKPAGRLEVLTEVLKGEAVPAPEVETAATESAEALVAEVAERDALFGRVQGLVDVFQWKPQYLAMRQEHHWKKAGWEHATLDGLQGLYDELQAMRATKQK